MEGRWGNFKDGSVEAGCQVAWLLIRPRQPQLLCDLSLTLISLTSQGGAGLAEHSALLAQDPTTGISVLCTTLSAMSESARAELSEEA